MMSEQLWRLDLKRFTADSRLSLTHEEAAGNAREVAEEAVLIEDGFEAAKDRLIAHAQLLGFDEFDDPALADEYATELLHAAVGEQR